MENNKRFIKTEKNKIIEQHKFMGSCSGRKTKMEEETKTKEHKTKHYQEAIKHFGNYDLKPYGLGYRLTSKDNMITSTVIRCIEKTTDLELNTIQVDDDILNAVFI